MRKVRLLFTGLGLVLLLGALSACTISIDTGSSLTIVNDTTFSMDYVSWTDGSGVVHTFGDDSVYDSIEGTYNPGLLPGHSATHTVTPGSAYLYFYDVSGKYRYRTAELVDVAVFEQKRFRIDSSTPLNILP